MSLWRHLTISAFFGAAPLVVSVSVSANNFQQVYKDAKVNDTQVRISQTQLQSSIYQRNKVLAQIKPNITANANASVCESNDKNCTAQNSKSSAASYDVTAQMKLFDLAARKQVKQYDIAIQKNKINVQQQQQYLMLRVVEAYIAYLKALESKHYAQSELEAVTKQYQQTRAYYDAGRVAVTDIKESQARRDSAIASLATANQSLLLANESITVITSKSYPKLAGGPSRANLDVKKLRTMDYWVKQAQANNHDVKKSQQDVFGAGQYLASRKLSYAPTVSAFVKHNGSTYEAGKQKLLTDNFTNDNTVGLSFTVPIYSPANNADLGSARTQLEQTKQSNVQYRRAAVQKVRSAYLNAKTSISQVNALKQAWLSNKTALDATQSGFEAGTRTAVDVITSVRELLRAKMNYNNAKYDGILALANLYYAAGQLTEQRVAEFARYF